MASLAWACICGTLLVVFYCAAGIAVSLLEGDPATAVHTLTDGPPLQQVMNALNGIGECRVAATRLLCSASAAWP
jgi:hypothetical protein